MSDEHWPIIAGDDQFEQRPSEDSSSVDHPIDNGALPEWPVENTGADPDPATHPFTAQADLWDARTPDDLVLADDPGPQQSVIPANQPGGPVVGDPGPQSEPATELPVFDPTATHDAAVTEDLAYWFQQNTNFTCGPSAVTAILNDYLGVQHLGENDVATWAQSNGLLSTAGMDVNDLDDALTHFGVPAQTFQGSDVSQIDRYLEADYSVILRVDAADYWTGQQNQDDLWHFVRIVDIDTDRGVAILSDSGVDYGRGLELPLNVLDGAWAEAGRWAVVTTTADSDPGRSVATAPGGISADAEGRMVSVLPEPSPLHGVPGLVVLPLTLSERLTQEWLLP